jgi:DNA-binding MarR family transcriptional regulator
MREYGKARTKGEKQQKRKSGRTTEVGPSPNDETCSCTVVRKAARRVSMLYDRALAPSGLRVTQYGLLAELARSGSMTITELADAMVMDRNGLGHNLRPLERERLVRMETGLDRRSRVVVMTDLGKKRFAQAKRLWVQAQTQFQSAFSVEQVQAFQSLMIAASSADYGDLIEAH